MLGKVTAIFRGGRDECPSFATAVDRVAHCDVPPMRVGVGRSESIATDADRHAPRRLELHYSVEHAQQLLVWLQEPGGLTGNVPFPELKMAYQDMVREIGWEPAGWNAVGRELRKLLGLKKGYLKKRIVYNIPSARQSSEVIVLQKMRA